MKSILSGLFIILSLVQFSCGSSKKSAVPCPDFSHSRSMKRGHAQLKNIYPAEQERFHLNSTLALHSRFEGHSKETGRKNRPASLYSVPLSRIAGIHANVSGAFPNRILARVQRASLVMPREGIRNPVYVSEETVQQACDTIVLRNGDILQGKVVEIGEREIRYKNCENIQGPVLVLSLSEVFMIKYPNGTRDYFTTERSQASPRVDALPKKTHGLALSGFIGSLVGLFVLGIPLGIMAVVFGSVSIGSIDKHPERYKGRGLAIASIIIGAVDIIGMIIVLSTM
jgi:hypothetical protein